MSRFDKIVEWSIATKKREYLLVLLLFLLLTIVFTWPLILHLNNGVIGGRGDSMLNTWIISWDAKTIFTHPSGLFQGNIIYPSRDVLAYSEHLFTMGVLAAPIYYLSGNPILSYNFLVFFAAILSGFGCYLLVKELTSSRWAGLVAGLFFAFCPYKLSKIGHLHIFFSPFLPFMLLYEYRFLRKGGKRNLLLFGFFYLAQSLASWHYLIFSSIIAGLMWIWIAIFSRNRKELLRLAGVVLAIAAAMLVIIPFALPYFRAHSRLPGFERAMSELEGYSATPEDFLRVMPESLVYGEGAPPFRLPGERGESVLFSGFVILIFALLALFSLRKKEEGKKADEVRERFPFRYGVIFPLLLVLTGFILVLGPKPHGISNPPFIALFHLGLLKFIRVPSRFYVIIALGLAMLAGYGVAWLIPRLGSGGKRAALKRLAPLCLFLIILFELLSVNFTIAEVPVNGEVPEVYSWLEEQGDVRVIELPTSPLSPAVSNDRDLGLNFNDVLGYHESEATIVYFSTYHWKKILNGYSGYFPYHYVRTMTEMQGFPSPRSLELLRGLQVDYVIWNWDALLPRRREEFNVRLFSTPGLKMVQDFGDYTVFEVEGGPVADAQDLEVDAFCPDAVPPAMDFTLGLLIGNESSAPFVSAEEEPQVFHAVFKDEEGTEVSRQDGEYWGPFFLQGGESMSLPLAVEAPPGAGRYLLELSLEEGTLGERDFTFSVEVGDLPLSVDPADLDGTVELVGEDSIHLATPDGLLPLVFEVENTGDTLWRSSVESFKGLNADPVGLVRIGVRWELNGKEVWGEQRCSLPGDVAPGQKAVVPTLVRPPAVPGTYRVQIGLVCEFYRWFGETIELELQIEDPMQEEISVSAGTVQAALVDVTSR